MNLVYIIISLVAGVEFCRAVPMREARKRVLSRRLNFDNSMGITNGTRVRIRDYPYAVSIVENGYQWGTGVILDGSWVLTSADAVYDIYPGSIWVRAGSEKYSLGGQYIQVQDVIVHEKYNWEAVDYNIALLKVSRKIRLGKKAQPATLGKTPLKDGTSVTVVGWGETEISGSDYPSSEFLLGANLTTMNLAKCQQDLKLKFKTTFCTSPSHIRPCDYDSGAPAIVGGVVYGLFTGTSVIHCKLDQPAVYTDVTQFLPWINSHINNTNLIHKQHLVEKSNF